MKTFLAIVTICSVLLCSQAAVRGLGERIECFRGAQTFMYEGRIRELLEGLREQLKSGIPDKGIPPLDPLVMKDLNLKIDEKMVNLDLNLDGVINGLMNWDITDIKFSIAGFKFSFGFLFPAISGSGSYKVNGAAGEMLPIYGSGDFNVLAQNLAITGDGKIGSRGSGKNQTLFLENFSIGVSLEKIKFDITGLMDDPQLSKLLSEMISDSLPDIIANFQDVIDEVGSSKVIELADGILGNLTMKDILDMLKPPKDPKRYIHCGDY